jgi:tetratricopeptide (TPR) repeat protein
MNSKDRKTEFLEQKKWGLFIGISKFKNKEVIKPLGSADKDATALRDFFLDEKKMGEYKFNKNYVRLLTNNLAKEEKVESAFETFLCRPTENDYVIIYLASHIERDQEGHVERSYFLVYDTDPDHMSESSINLRRIIEAIQDCKAKNINVFIDACFSASIAREIPNSMRRTARDVSKHKINMLVSSRPDQVSSEGRDHGLFTEWLLSGLDGHAEQGRKDKSSLGIITVGELFSYVKKNVSDEDMNQTPLAILEDAPDTPIVVRAKKLADIYLSISKMVFQFSDLLNDSSRIDSAIKFLNRADDLYYHFVDAKTLIHRGHFWMRKNDWDKAFKYLDESFLKYKEANLNGIELKQLLVDLCFASFFLTDKFQSVSTAINEFLVYKDINWGEIDTLIKVLKYQDDLKNQNTNIQALLIGSDSVIDSDGLAIGCEKDINNFRTLLHEKFGFKNESIEEVKNQDPEYIIERISQIGNECEKLLIYYTGDGDTGDGNNFMIYSGPQKEKRTGLSIDKFFGKLEDVKAHQIFLVLDSDQHKEIRNKVTELATKRKIACIIPNPPGGEAYINEREEGVFTSQLCETLKTMDVSKNTVVDLSKKLADDFSRRSDYFATKVKPQAAGNINDSLSSYFRAQIDPDADKKVENYYNFLFGKSVFGKNVDQINEIKSEFIGEDLDKHKENFGDALLDLYPENAFFHYRDIDNKSHQVDLKMAKACLLQGNFKRSEPYVKDARKTIKDNLAKLCDPDLRVLLVGCNYSKATTAAENDIDLLKLYFENTPGKVKVDTLTGEKATKEAIIQNFQSLVEHAKEEPALFYYSGTGGSDEEKSVPVLYCCDGVIGLKKFYDLHAQNYPTNLLSIFDVGWNVRDPLPWEKRNSLEDPKNAKPDIYIDSRYCGMCKKNTSFYDNFIQYQKIGRYTFYNSSILRGYELVDKYSDKEPQQPIEIAESEFLVSTNTEQSPRNKKLGILTYFFYDFLREKYSENEHDKIVDLKKHFTERMGDWAPILISTKGDEYLFKNGIIYKDTIKSLTDSTKYEKISQFVNDLSEDFDTTLLPEDKLEIHLNLGIAHLLLQNYDKSKKYLDSANKIVEEKGPNKFYILYYLGRLNFEMGKFHEAKNYLENAVTCPEKIHQNLSGAIYYYLVKCLKQATETETQYVDRYKALGEPLGPL